MDSTRLHVLEQLKLPDRFEQLHALLGEEVARLIVEPVESTRTALQTVASSIQSRGEGMFLPVSGDSGAGKTTLASNLSVFFPSDFTQTVSHTEDVSFEELRVTAEAARSALPANETRITPINIDHREGNPPDRSELAALKRFMREPSPGSSTLVVWPETDGEVAAEMGGAYEDIAGSSVIKLPLEVEGPPRESWQDIALQTLELVNEVPSIQELGVDPRDYEPKEFETLGAFLRQLSNDFDRRRISLLNETKKPVSLVVTFCTPNVGSGVLNELRRNARYGLLDPHALVSATSGSKVGEWWGERPGLLTQTVVRLTHGSSLCLRR